VKQAAYNARETLRLETREKLTPLGRKLSEWLEKPKSLPELLTKYPTAEEFITATGRTRSSVNNLSRLGGITGIISHPAVQGMGLILWEALTDDPDRSGSFVGEPIFHPYANAERDKRLDEFALQNGFSSYEIMTSILAYKAGCKDCIETYGMDLTQIPAKDLAKGSFIYDPQKAEKFMDKQLTRKGPAYPTIGSAPSD
jgi:hypothetical protein